MVAGAPPRTIDLDTAVEEVQALTAGGMKRKPAVAQVAATYGIAKNLLYGRRPRSIAERSAESAGEQLRPWTCPKRPSRCRHRWWIRTAIWTRRCGCPGSTRAEAIARAAEVGVTRIVQIGCDPDDSRWAVEAAERWPGVVAGVAIHPNDAARLGSGSRRRALR